MIYIYIQYIQCPVKGIQNVLASLEKIPLQVFFLKIFTHVNEF